MAFWLARERDGQQTDYIQRFDPRFWTINFPRPTMGCVFSRGADKLRAYCDFQTHDALAGLIWWSKDTLDHPLLAYETDRDYSRTTLSFRWRSNGILPLDAVHGPTLTIEGKDDQGADKTWYVRLWNYASGDPDDATITLPFSALQSGWDISGGGDMVHPHAIERMFISLAPPLYDPSNSDLLPSPATGRVQLSEISCEGDRALLEIGDAMIPPHGIGIATAYDDCYNQTPARLLRNIRGLGYRGELIHYVGMSHYYQMAADTGGQLRADPAATLSFSADGWHNDFFEQCRANGYVAIASLSFELFAEHCPPEWMQRAYDGAPALTGWEPPSSLLSATQDAPQAYLQNIATHLAGLQAAAGLPVRMQIGEPWWWLNPGFAPCIYDDDARAKFSDAAPEITNISAGLSPDQLVVLVSAADHLGSACQGIRDAILTAHGTEAEVYILLFTPTILDPSLPNNRLLNLPDLWAHPHFDRLQLEDYDWLTAGAEALRRQGYQAMNDALQYPLEKQDYMAGFVLDPDDAEAMWPLIDAGLNEAAARGVPRLFVWALPQVCRDGYTRLPDAPPGEEEEEDDMQAFDDVLYPLALGRDAGVSPEFSTSIVLTASGHERRNSQWSDARLRFDVGPGLRSEHELGTLLEFFRARRGAARGFRLSDPFDFSSNGMSGNPTMLDQQIGTGDGLAAIFQLEKTYGSGEEPQTRRITRPRAETITVSIDGVEETNWTLEAGGKIILAEAPPIGAVIRAGFLFDVPVRFAEDRLDITGASFAAGEAPSVPLIEIREEV